MLRRKREPHSLQSEKLLAGNRSSSSHGGHATQKAHLIELEAGGPFKFIHSFVHSFICSCVCMHVCVGQESILSLHHVGSELRPMVHGPIFAGLLLRNSRSLSWVIEFIMLVPLMRIRIQTRDKYLKEISCKVRKIWRLS